MIDLGRFRLVADGTDRSSSKEESSSFEVVGSIASLGS